MKPSIWFGIVVSLMYAARAPGDILYTATPIPGNNFGYAINDSGQVTGVLPGTFAFLYSNGVVTPLGPAPGFPFSIGLAINNLGQITGYAMDSTPVGNEGAFLYSNGTMTIIGASAGLSSGRGINDLGQITGSSAGGAFLYSGGAITFIGDTDGNAINNLGQITGGAGTVFLYSNGVMTNIGSGYGYAINELGEVTGTNASGHAFIYSDGAITDLGTLPGGSGSVGYAINDSGQVVGDSTVSGGAEHGFVYSNGVMTDLNSVVPLPPGFAITDARGINNLGQILVNTNSPSSQAFVLMPVPESSAWLLCASGLIALVGFRRWNNRHTP